MREPHMRSSRMVLLQIKSNGKRLRHGRNSIPRNTINHQKIIDRLDRDRAFRRRKSFGEKEAEAARELINCAAFNGVYLEMNYASMHTKRQFWYEFWDMLSPQALMIYGIDAHSVDEMVKAFEELRNGLE